MLGEEGRFPSRGSCRVLGPFRWPVLPSSCSLVPLRGEPLRRYQLILEIKSVGDSTDLHRAQMLNYLRATGFRLGLLVNFGKQSKLQWERLVLSLAA